MQRPVTHQYFECHITLETEDVESVKNAVEKVGWKFSKIDGDPGLGAGIRCYATQHFNGRTSERVAIERMKQTVAELEILVPGKIRRQKVERIIYDVFVRNNYKD